MTDQELNQFKKDTQDAITKLKGQVDDQEKKLDDLKAAKIQAPLNENPSNSLVPFQFFPLLKVTNLFTSRLWAEMTTSRAKDTVYKNGKNSIMVMATFQCTVSVAGGNAYVQAKSDKTSTPTVVASGKVGIETGLVNENNTFQLVFIVAPEAYYKVVSATTNGTVTLENWFEISF